MIVDPRHALRAGLCSRTVCIALGASCVGIGLLATARSARAAIPYTVYVGNEAANSVTSINAATNLATSTIASPHPSSIAITPDGQAAWFTDFTSEGTLTPITLSTDSLGGAIPVGSDPNEVAITPNGSEAYVTNTGSNTVTPINLLTDTPGSAVPVGHEPIGVAISPDGTRAYVANYGSSTVTPINLLTNTPGSEIPVGEKPIGIAITPDGTTAYVANSGSGTVSPITLATNAAGTPIAVGSGPAVIAITPDGTTAYVTNKRSNSVTPISLATDTAKTDIPVGEAPIGIAITPDQATAYVTNSASNTVTPINLASETADAPISVGTRPDALAITPDQAPVASFTANGATAGSPSSFNASASTVAYGTITSYAWKFGDGTSATTSTPSVTHTYASAGNYTVMLTETDAAGTSTTQVFTGQTVSRNGGPSAQAAHTLQVATPPADPPHSPPSPARPTPTVISARSLRITSHGAVLIPLSCPNAAREGCKGVVTIQLDEPAAGRARALASRCGRGCRPIGSVHYQARAGQRFEVRVPIASSARKLLKRRKALRVKLTVTSVLDGQTATAVRTMTLRASAQPRRARKVAARSRRTPPAGCLRGCGA